MNRTSTFEAAYDTPDSAVDSDPTVKAAVSAFKAADTRHRAMVADRQQLQARVAQIIADHKAATARVAEIDAQRPAVAAAVLKGEISEAVEDALIDERARLMRLAERIALAGPLFDAEVRALESPVTSAAEAVNDRQSDLEAARHTAKLRLVKGLDA